MTLRITRVEVLDVRYPTSDTLKGSDPFHKKPDYSAAYIRLHTNDPSLTGIALVFMIGAGTDWVVYGARDLGTVIEGLELKTFAARPGTIYRRLLDHHQLRWLGDGGVFLMAVGGLMNALWDLAAKHARLPMWRYLAALPAETIVDAVNFRHLRDVLTPEQALEILKRQEPARHARIGEFTVRGPEAYSTAAWSGLSDEQIIAACKEAVEVHKLRSIKAKVGIDLADDQRRLGVIRATVGAGVSIRIDANQIWGVDEAIQWVSALAPHQPLWIEEPTHPDDILGYRKIRHALAPFGIGVAGGEHHKNPVIVKQALAAGALDFYQVDATRMGGLNDVLAVLLLAAHFQIPVCPHGGGIGLCAMIQHIGALDQIRIGGQRRNRVVEWIDFLADALEQPLRIKDGHYDLPEAPGWGLELKPEFVAQHLFPEGPVWSKRPAERIGARFEA